MEDAVSLSLCTRDTYAHLGKQAHVLGKLIDEDEVRLRFLKTLQEDLDPHLMMCEKCLWIHKVPQRAQNWTTWSRPDLKCTVDDRDEDCEEDLHRYFGFGDVQVLAGLRRRGLEEALVKYQRRLAKQFMGYNSANDFINDFQVRLSSDGQVYARRQEWFPIHSFHRAVLSDTSHTFNVCKHVNYHTIRELRAQQIDLAEKRVKHYRVLGYLQSSTPEAIVNDELDWGWTPLFRCKYCKTAYRFDFGLVSKATSMCAIVLTKWMCLGDGKSRYSGLWKHYRSETYDSHPLSFQAGTVYAGFEGTTREADYRPKWTEKLDTLWTSTHNKGDPMGMLAAMVQATKTT